MNDNYYLLQITLLDTQPLIWRSLAVPDCISLDRLHDVIQIALGWEDKHQHQFVLGDRYLCEAPDSPKQGEDEGLVQLNELLQQQGQYLHYYYDLEANWQHLITLQDADYSPENLPNPLYCLEGQYACPPEDIGGQEGYQNLLAMLQNPLEIMKDPQYKDYSDALMWFADADADSKIDMLDHLLNAFDPCEVNSQLELYCRWARDRTLSWAELA